MKKTFKPKTINLKRKGAAKVLGELEAKVMKLIWQAGEMTVRSVRDTLARRRRKLSFNSVMTVMNRLVDKGLLKKCRQTGEYTYCPTITQEDFSRALASNIITAVVKDPALFSAAGFAELSLELDKETLKKLQQFLKMSGAGQTHEK